MTKSEKQKVQAFEALAQLIAELVSTDDMTVTAHVITQDAKKKARNPANRKTKSRR